MRVLSLFDGMSCGRLALADAGINVTEYHASEIDQHAIKVTKANWPDTVQLGSVVNVTVNQHYDLLIGGSPCQSFSFAGKRKGMATKDEQEILTLSHYLQLKADGYEFEGQSYLFWEYVRILQECKEINPNIKFLLENVLMSEKWERVITQTMGVKPIQINSALVSAQNRNRLYWTNIGLQPQGLFGFEESIIPQPADRGILLKDILQTNVPEKYYLSDKMLNYLHTRKDNFNGGKINFKHQNDKGSCLNASNGLDISDNIIVDGFINGTILNGEFKERTDGKSLNIDANYHKGHDNHGARTVIQINRNTESGGQQPYQQNRVYSPDGISPAFMAQMSCGSYAIIEDAQCVAIRGGAAILTPKRTEYGKQVRKAYEAGELKTERKNIQQLEPRNDGKTNTLTSVQKDNLVMLNENQKNKFKPNVNTDKANTLTLAQGRMGSSSEYMDSVSKIYALTSRIRRLTPTECERLQTVPDGYTAHVSDTQRYKMLGNGWTIKVISHIFSYILTP
jgi:site-specific DNA-cytosine methylase